MIQPPMEATGLAALAAHYGLPEDILVSLARVVVQADRELVLGAGAELCYQNDPADALYFLLEGSIRVGRYNRLNLMEEIATAVAPAVLGHTALVLQTTRSVSLVAGDTGARVIALPKAQVESLITEHSREADALRRIILAAQLDHHHRSVVDLLQALEIDAELPVGWTPIQN